MRSGPGALELLPLSSTGEPQEAPDGSWLPKLGLLALGAGEPWEGPSSARLGMLLSALGAGVQLLSRRLLGWL